MRCIEMIGKTLEGMTVGTINSNMRCIEIRQYID